MQYVKRILRTDTHEKEIHVQLNNNGFTASQLKTDFPEIRKAAALAETAEYDGFKLIHNDDLESPEEALIFYTD